MLAAVLSLTLLNLAFFGRSLTPDWRLSDLKYPTDGQLLIAYSYYYLVMHMGCCGVGHKGRPCDGKKSLITYYKVGQENGIFTVRRNVLVMFLTTQRLGSCPSIFFLGRDSS